jgi:hypothetical protein
MKTLGMAAIAIALAIAVYASVAALGRTSPADSTGPIVAPRANDGQSAQLVARLDELQRNVAALKAQLASQQTARSAPQPLPASGDASSPEPQSVEAQRAADAERLRDYMVGVAQSFANEKIDPVWASHASARVRSTFEGDEGLSRIAHTVECRAQTCRVQIDDDGSGSLNARIPYLTLGLADVLPQVSAEHIDQANGRGAMVLYMTNQRP